MSAEVLPEPVVSKQVPWGRLALRGSAFTYLAVLLLIPLVVILQDGFHAGLAAFRHQISLPIARSALFLSVWTSLVMTIINMLMGTLTAYALVRYEFPGKRLINAIIDLPLAVPTLVTGVMLVVLYGPQSTLGAWFKTELHFPIIFAPPGIVLALLFITFPSMVRAIQPVLMALEKDQERAASTLGASSWTIFRRIVLPPLLLPITTGSLLSFARAMGEFGAIVIVAGNIPFRSQTAAVYVLGEVESENRLGASAVSIVMIAIAFGSILLVDMLRRRRRGQ